MMIKFFSFKFTVFEQRGHVIKCQTDAFASETFDTCQQHSDAAQQSTHVTNANIFIFFLLPLSCLSQFTAAWPTRRFRRVHSSGVGSLILDRFLCH